jgi:hypothetical protein
MAGEIPSILARPAAQCAIRWGKWSILLCLLRKSGEFVRTAVRISPARSALQIVSSRPRIPSWQCDFAHLDLIGT